MGDVDECFVLISCTLLRLSLGISRLDGYGGKSLSISDIGPLAFGMNTPTQ